MTKENNNTTRIIQAEYRLLHCLINHRECLNDARVTENLFVHPSAKSIFKTICDLNKREIPITRAELLQSCKDIGVTAGVIETIFAVDDDSPTLDTILPDLLAEQLRATLLDKINSLKETISLSTELDSDSILKQLYECDDLVIHSSKNQTSLMSIEEWSDTYIEELQQRKTGKKYTYGDLNLDEELFKGAYPGAITTIAAATGSGKSTFTLNLMNNLIEQNVPCMYISVEMGAIDTMDRLIAMRQGIPNDELYNQGNIDAVISSVIEEKKNLLTRNKFYFVEDPSIDLTKLRSMIREFKQRTKQDYCLVVIDLLTQMKGFLANSSMRGAGTPQTIENSMNELNALAKSENVHIIGVAQFNRGTDSGKVTSIESIQNFRPTANDIKNSSALLERARLVLSVFRAKPYAIKYLVDSQGNPFPEVEDMEDYLELQVLKNSSGEVGKIYKYFYDGAHFRLLPLSEIDEEKMNRMVESEDY